jgi:Type II/IV secretion system protein.
MLYSKFVKDIGDISDYVEFIKNVKDFFGSEVSTRFKYNNSYFKSVLKGSLNNDSVSNKEVVYLSIDEMTGLDYHLSEINLNDKDKEILDTHLKSPSGVIIISGIKESGKTTTLLSMLEKNKKREKKAQILLVLKIL